MKSVHLVLQGKGGVGKSLIASLIAQHLKEEGRPFVAFDTDPVQSTFVGVRALGAEAVDLLDDEQQVNVAAMDEAMSRILAEDTDFVVDNGAASFVPLSTYLLSDGLLCMIAEHKRIVVHTVIVGGEAMADTTLALESLIEQFPFETSIVVWTNPFFGELVDAGCPFDESTTYKAAAPRITATVNLPRLDPHYAGAVFRRMLTARLTFAEAKVSEEFNLIAKARLANVWAPIKAQLAEVL